MSHFFPEQPLLIYPSLAKKYGVEEALLLGIYHQFAQHHGHSDAEGSWYFIARRSEWLAMAEFWDDETLAQVTNNLVGQGVIHAEFNNNGSIRIGLAESTAQTETANKPSTGYLAPDASFDLKKVEIVHDEGNSPPVLATSYLSVEEKPAAPTTLLNAEQQSDEAEALPTPAKGPAPSFGGSTGWSRRQDDELETLFKEQEKRHLQLHEITLNWRPTQTTLQLLAKHSIPVEFIDGLRDEFIAYWLAQGQKKKSWDPHFIEHAKRKWVREQSRQGREQRSAADMKSEASGERYQSTSRAEKRERISKAVMDIKNVDW